MTGAVHESSGIGEEVRVRLGYIDHVEIIAVPTTAPWTLGVDALVVPAESVHSGVGRDLLTALGLDEDLIRSAISTVDSAPVMIRLVKSDSEEYRLLVFVADPGLDQAGAMVGEAAGIALARAVDAAVDASASSIAVPLGFGRHYGADFLRACWRAFKETWNAGRLQRLVVFGGGQDTSTEMSDAWYDLMADKPIGVRDVSRRATLLGGVVNDLVPANTAIESNRDKLSVSTYASMMASVIASTDTPLPLSIGVFGEWGSGKSFFMGLLRHEVARRSGGSHCERVIPIGFNAWHYADTDLWASLGDLIFRELSEAVAPAADRAGAVRQRLLDKINVHKDLESSVQEAADAAAGLQNTIDEAAEKHQATTRDLLHAARYSSRVQERFEKVWTDLGIDNEVEQVRLLSSELRDSVGEAEQISNLSRERHGRLALAGAVAVLLLSGFAAVVVPWLGLAGGATALGGALLGSVWLSRVRSGLTSLRELGGELRAGVELASGERFEAGIRSTLDRLRKVELDRRVAEQQLGEVVTEVADLTAELAELHPARKTSTFLEDRAQGERYAGSLSTVSVIRKDFEELVDLLTQWRAEPAGDEMPPIDRIVLYIDDLDRCGPKQVVRVLEAVHLLLALELFVVVIGVDPRWLLRSVSKHYAENLTDSTFDNWQMAPEDYLEKIINVPFSLPRMDPDNVEDLLRSTLSVPPVPSPTRSPRRYGGYGSGGTDSAQPTGASVFRITAEVHPNVDLTTPPPEPLPLTEREMTFLGHIGPLVRTPRAAKRLFNIYRMIRENSSLRNPADFLGTAADPGQFRVVMVLLAIVSAAPRLASEFCAEVESHATHQPSWPEFVNELEKTKTTGEWPTLLNNLAKITGSEDLPGIYAFRQWLPTVRRFSYMVDGS
ncbi:P-loop NTPase fold protein [Amycolatopsis azurea]|uniref:P-loop NTPase fold protein n=1 Tax=Amycolatopsis azurea TaxID=36819 RepID=UPI003826EB4A